mmetsp:Transcript_20991/g.62626  ORF Transcript_20991/g.62626 Transcript_20991/m.62626 type:complete len:437 (+) Transcript_20991:334-1644(+)
MPAMSPPPMPPRPPIMDAMSPTPPAPPAGEAPADDAETVDGSAPPEPPSSSPEPAPAEAGATTLRHAVTYAWRDLLDTKGRDWAMADCELEEASVLLAAAQALLSRAAREPVNDSNVLGTYASLRRAAGLLAASRTLTKAAEAAPPPPAPPQPEKKKGWFVGNHHEVTEEDEAPKKKGFWAKKDAEPEEKISQDLRLQLAEAWAALALAEAQHATIRKAAASPHIEWSLLASLCVDERDRYAATIAKHVANLTADGAKATSIKEWAGKRVCVAFLRAHVDYKAKYFEALARYALGAAALETAVAETDEVACGVALGHLTEAARRHREAQAAAQTFVTAAKPVCYVDSPVVPLGESMSLIQTALDRANQLNNGIFHRPVPPAEPLPAPKSLVTALPYEEPPPSPLWTRDAWAAFDPDLIPPPTHGPASGARDCCAIA